MKERTKKKHRHKEKETGNRRKKTHIEKTISIRLEKTMSRLMLTEILFCSSTFIMKAEEWKQHRNFTKIKYSLRILIA